MGEPVPFDGLRGFACLFESVGSAKPKSTFTPEIKQNMVANRAKNSSRG